MRSKIIWLIGYFLSAQIVYWLMSLYGEDRVLTWVCIAMLTLMAAALYEWFTKPHLDGSGQPISRWRYRLTTVCFIVCCGFGVWLFVSVLIDVQSG